MPSPTESWARDSAPEPIVRLRSREIGRCTPVRWALRLVPGSWSRVQTLGDQALGSCGGGLTRNFPARIFRADVGPRVHRGLSAAAARPPFSPRRGAGKSVSYRNESGRVRRSRRTVIRLSLRVGKRAGVPRSTPTVRPTRTDEIGALSDGFNASLPSGVPAPAPIPRGRSLGLEDGARRPCEGAQSCRNQVGSRDFPAGWRRS